MRKLTVLIILFASLLAPAYAEKVWDTWGSTFRVDFPGKVTRESRTPGIVKLYSHDKTDPGAVYGVAVFTGEQRRHMADLKRYLVKQGIKALDDATHRDVHQGSVPGIEFQGIDRQGTPMTIRLYVDKKHSYVVAASGFDMTHNRNFVESFRIKGQK